MAHSNSGFIDGTPEKRLFLSIISDYDLFTGLCELVDNALDYWIMRGQKKKLSIDIILDADRQLIKVQDNAGGLSKDKLRLLVAPGASGNDPKDEIIGIFGVGGKRAGVALGEVVEIETRANTGPASRVVIDTEWLNSDDWDLRFEEVQRRPAGKTTVEISKLRQSFSAEDVERFSEHLSETYAEFLSAQCKITVNGQAVSPKTFKNWSYPPEYLPRAANFKVNPLENRLVDIEIEAGLIKDRDPEGDNYGVYIYCNERLIMKEWKEREVGYFVSGEAGVPHPDASLCRVIVKISGSAELMPWNSSKSGINKSHPVFSAIQGRIIELTKYYSSLSRRLKNDWQAEVFKFTSGQPVVIPTSDIAANRKLVLPQLPRVRKLAKEDELKKRNQKILKDKPWTLGLVEASGAIELVQKKRWVTSNRIALVLLDSNLEISLKEFIVHRNDLFPPHTYTDARISQMMRQRSTAINEVKNHANLTDAEWARVRHYYGLRNKLIHERATVQITDQEIDDFRELVEKLIKSLFGIKFPKR